MPLWEHFAIGLICESGVEAAQAAYHSQTMSSHRSDQIHHLEWVDPKYLTIFKLSSSVFADR
jgi:hypothetical protein